jgi:hypothetical protein
VLALDLSHLFSTALLALGIHLLVRRWGGSVPAAVFGATLAIAAPWRVGAATVRPHVLWVHYIPFIVLFLDRYLTGLRVLDLALAGACFVLQVMTSYYAGYAALVAVAVSIVAHAASAAGRALRAALGMGIALGVSAIVSYPYLVLARAGVIHPVVSDEMLSGVFGVWGTPALLTTTSVGTIAVAGSALLLVLRPWRRTSGRRPPYGTLFAIAAAGYVLAIGPEVRLPRSPTGALRALWHLVTVTDPSVMTSRFLSETGPQAYRIPTPWVLLRAVIPGFAQLRSPARFGVLPAITLPITAALAVDHVARFLGRFRALVLLGAGAVVLAAIPPTIPVRIEVGAGIPPAYEWLRRYGDRRPLLEAPVRGRAVGLEDVARDARAMYLATYHRLPLLNGYSGYAPPGYGRRRAIAERLPEPGALHDLCAETGLGWVLLHRDQLPPTRPRWPQRPERLVPVATFGDDVVFSVLCPAPPAHAAS